MADLHAELLDIADDLGIDESHLIAWVEEDRVTTCTAGHPVWEDCWLCGPTFITPAVRQRVAVIKAMYRGDVPHADADPLTIEVHVCDERRSFIVSFDGPAAHAEATALRYMDHLNEQAKHAGYTWGNYAFHLDESNPPSPEQFPKLYDRLFPLCGHGMSLDLCEDPINHYGRD